jgi:hypothetical protein
MMIPTSRHVDANMSQAPWHLHTHKREYSGKSRRARRSSWAAWAAGAAAGSITRSTTRSTAAAWAVAARWEESTRVADNHQWLKSSHDCRRSASRNGNVIGVGFGPAWQVGFGSCSASAQPRGRRQPGETVSDCFSCHAKSSLPPFHDLDFTVKGGGNGGQGLLHPRNQNGVEGKFAVPRAALLDRL